MFSTPRSAPIHRLEDPDLLTGRSRFIADLTEADLGLDQPFAHAAFVRSPIGHGRLVTVDCSAARSAHGVHAVFTVDDLDVAPSHPWSPALSPGFTQPLLANGVVRFVGEPIAVVLAASEAEAIDAAELVEIDVAPLDVVVDPRAAATTEILLFDVGTAVGTAGRAAAGEPGWSNVVDRIDWEVHGHDGDRESLFAGCDTVVEHTLEVPRQAAAPIEPRGLITWWSPSAPASALGSEPASGSESGSGPESESKYELHARATTQRPHGYRDQLAALLDMAPERIHVTCPHVGGGFGGKPSRGAEEHLLPVVAGLAGRPVRWVESRSDNLTASNHARAEGFVIRIGGDRAGRIHAVDVDMVKDAGAYPTSCAMLPAAYTRDNLSGCYAVKRLAFSSVSAATNTAPTSAYRGAGRAPYIAALESAVDAFASAINKDPADVRRLNLIPASAMPWTTPVGAIYDEADYPADLEAALNAIGYEQWRVRQADRLGGGVNQPVLGIGVACYNHKTGSAGGEEALVSITADGGARVVTGSTDQGHGHRTAWTQIITSRLGIPADQVEVVEGSSDAISSGQGAIGSRSIQTAGAAIHNSCDELIERSRVLAAAELEASAADIVFTPTLSSEIGGGGADTDLEKLPSGSIDSETIGGRFHVVGTPARFVEWQEVAARAVATDVDLTCGDLHEPEHVSYPSGSHVAVVELDVETGRIQLAAFAASDDVGVRLNPTIVDGQLHGGIVAGIGQALGEQMVYDTDGNLLTGTFASYQIPTADEVPMLQLVGTEGRSSFHAYGYKGVGESGTIGAIPAVLNAVNDALRSIGARPVGLPCTPETVWRSACEATGSSGM